MGSERRRNRTRADTCQERLDALVQESVLVLRARGWPVPAVRLATSVPAVRRWGLARAADVRLALVERRRRDAIRRDAGRPVPLDPVPESLWEDLIVGLDDRAAQALVVVADARGRFDPAVHAWLALTHVDTPESS